KAWYKEIAASFKFSELAKQKEFFKIMVATLVFNIGPKIFLPWIFEFFTQLPINIILIAMVAGIYVIVGFGMSILLGKFCDAYGRKKPLVISIILGSIGFMLVPLAVYTLNLALVFVMVVLILFILNGVPTILSAWTQDLLPSGKIGQFTGINNMSSTVNQLIGVWIGGVVYALTNGNIAWNMFIASFVFLASIPLFLTVRETLREKPAETP
nr:MFS transporter [Candidatus Sigynarchaeota archaeon]